MIALYEEKINYLSEKNKINFLNRESCNDYLHKLIQNYEETDNFEYIICSHCGSDKLIKYGVYERNIGIYGVYETIKIKRVMCKECGHTHAIIPSFILPFFQNALVFVLMAIEQIEVEERCVVNVSNEINITRQLLYFWITRFNSHLTRLKVTFSYEIKKIMKSLYSARKNWKEYEKINGINFLEKVPT